MTAFGSIASTAIAALPRTGGLTPPTLAPPLDLDKSGRYPDLHKTTLGPSLLPLLTDEPLNYDMLFDGGVAELQVETYGFMLMSTWTYIYGWALMVQERGSISFDLWKLPLATVLAGTLPTVTDSIVGGAYPAVSNIYAAEDNNLPEWSPILAQNDVLAYRIRSCSGIIHATLTLKTLRIRLQ